MKFAIKFFLASLVSAGFLWLAFRDIDAAALWHFLCSVEPLYVALYMLGLFATQVARAGRWQALVEPVARLTPMQAWRMSNVGNMLIMLLPLRLGELSRPFMLKKQTRVPLAAGVGAALVERVLDGLIVTLMFFLTTGWVERAYPAYPVSPTLKTGAWIALTIFSSALLVILVTLWTHQLVPTLLRKTVGRASAALSEKIITLLLTFVDGMRALPSVRAVAVVVGYTLIYWFANALGMVALIHGFGWQLPWLAGFTVVCVLVIGVMIPAGPGLLGTYQAAIIAGLGTYGVEHNAAAAFSVVGYLGTLVMLVACGMPHMLGKNWAQETGTHVPTEQDERIGTLGQ